VAVIHPCSAPASSRQEVSLAWQKVVSHGGEKGELVQAVIGWVSSCWLCSGQPGAGAEQDPKQT